MSMMGSVFAVNTLASLTEPIMLMVLPSLGAAAFGVAQHDGALAGVRAAFGGLVLLLISAAALQLLLALLDDLLRREWMRYVAAFLFTLTIIGLQLAANRGSRLLVDTMHKVGLTPDDLLGQVEQLFVNVPTVVGPAVLAGAHPPGWFATPALAAAACLAAIALPIWWGSRVMARAAVREEVQGRTRGRVRAGAAGAFGRRWPGLTVSQAVLLSREWLYLLRTPAVLYQLVVVPVTVIVVILLGRARERGYDVLVPAIVMTGTLSGRNLMLWGFDGAGIRSLFLLPFAARDLVLTKNLAWLGSTFVEAGVTFTAITLMRPGRFLPDLTLMVLGYAALAFVAAAVGTWVSIKRPVKARERGLSRRSPGGIMGLFAYLAVLALGALLVLMVLAARSLTPDRFDALASHAVAILALVVCAGLWWLAMERHADELERSREKLLDVIAKTADA
jgi:hypothetical protein